MSRHRRITIVGAPHHLVLRGNNRRRLFSYPRDYLRFLALLQRQVRRAAFCDVNSIALMSNHVHIMATPKEEGGLARFIKPVAQTYAQERNRKLGASGKLFEERFYSAPVVSMEHCAATDAYIVLNAVRAGIVEHPSEYRWSSYHRFSPDGNGAWARSFDFCQPSIWMRQLGRSGQARQEAYRSFVEQARLHTDSQAPANELRVVEVESSLRARSLRRPDGSSAE